MESPIRINSVFDKFHKLENPSGWFTWQPPPSGYKIIKDNIICSGELQEIDTITEAIHTTKFYAVTIREFIRFPVSY